MNEIKTEVIKDFSAEQLADFVPYTLAETVAFLEVIHPLKITDKTANEREIWIEAGKQELIAFLKQTLNKNNDKRIEELLNV